MKVTWFVPAFLIVLIPCGRCDQFRHDRPADFLRGRLDGSVSFDESGTLLLGEIRNRPLVTAPVFPEEKWNPFSKVNGGPLFRRSLPLNPGSFLPESFWKGRPPRISDVEWHEGTLHFLMKPAGSSATSFHLYRVPVSPDGRFGTPRLRGLAPPGVILEKLAVIEDRLYAAGRFAGETERRLYEFRASDGMAPGWFDLGAVPNVRGPFWDLIPAGETLLIVVPRQKRFHAANTTDPGKPVSWRIKNLPPGDWYEAVDEVVRSFQRNRDSTALVVNRFVLPAKVHIREIRLTTPGEPLPYVRYRTAPAVDRLYGKWSERRRLSRIPVFRDAQALEYELYHPDEETQTRIDAVKLIWDQGRLSLQTATKEIGSSKRPGHRGRPAPAFSADGTDPQRGVEAPQTAGAHSSVPRLPAPPAGILSQAGDRRTERPDRGASPDADPEPNRVASSPDNSQSSGPLNPVPRQNSRPQRNPSENPSTHETESQNGRLIPDSFHLLGREGTFPLDPEGFSSTFPRREKGEERVAEDFSAIPEESGPPAGSRPSVADVGGSGPDDTETPTGSYAGNALPRQVGSENLSGTFPQTSRTDRKNPRKGPRIPPVSPTKPTPHFRNRKGILRTNHPATRMRSRQGQAGIGGVSAGARGRNGDAPESWSQNGRVASVEETARTFDSPPRGAPPPQGMRRAAFDFRERPVGKGFRAVRFTPSSAEQGDPTASAGGNPRRKAPSSSYTGTGRSGESGVRSPDSRLQNNPGNRRESKERSIQRPRQEGPLFLWWFPLFLWLLLILAAAFLSAKRKTFPRDAFPHPGSLAAPPEVWETRWKSICSAENRTAATTARENSFPPRGPIRERLSAGGKMGRKVEWSVSEPLPRPMTPAIAFYRRGRVFVVDSRGTVCCARIRADGSLCPWGIRLGRLPAGRKSHGVALLRERIACVVDGKVYSAHLENDRLGEWISGGGISGLTGRFSLAGVEDRLFIVGGQGEKGNLPLARSIRLTSSGKITDLRTHPPLPEGVEGGTLLYGNGCLYWAGGTRWDGRPSPCLFAACLNEDLELTDWKAGADLPIRVRRPTFQFWEGCLWLIGGTAREKTSTVWVSEPKGGTLPKRWKRLDRMDAEPVVGGALIRAGGRFLLVGGRKLYSGGKPLLDVYSWSVG